MTKVAMYQMLSNSTSCYCLVLKHPACTNQNITATYTTSAMVFIAQIFAQF